MTTADFLNLYAESLAGSLRDVQPIACVPVVANIKALDDPAANAVLVAAGGLILVANALQCVIDGQPEDAARIRELLERLGHVTAHCVEASHDFLAASGPQTPDAPHKLN